jgi:hypothetical protein
MKGKRSRSFSFVNTSGDGALKKVITTLAKGENVFHLIAGKVQDEEDSKVTFVGKIRFHNALSPQSVISKLFVGNEIECVLTEEHQSGCSIYSDERKDRGTDSKEMIATLTMLSGTYTHDLPEVWAK